MILKHVLFSVAFFGTIVIAAFPGGPYTIWSAANIDIHTDNVGGAGNPINAESYVNGRRNQYWFPVLASASTTNVYYIHSNVSGSFYANGAAGAAVSAQPFASPWLFTPVPGAANDFTITVPLTNPVIALTLPSNTTGLQLTLQPLISGNLLQHWVLTDHGPPSSVNAPA